MQLGILGLPKVGKTTLFNTLTAASAETSKYAASKETHVGIARVPDRRLEQLRELFRPRKYTPATVQYVDIPGLQRGEGRESLDLARLRTVDALVHVVRVFADPELVHSDGSVDPGRDLATVELELILADYELVERRLERLKQAEKRGLGLEEARERELLSQVLLPALEAEQPLRLITLAPEDELHVRGFQLLSAKPLLVVFNVDEGDVSKSPDALGLVLPAGSEGVLVSAPIEAEISRLPAADQGEFLTDLGLEEASLPRLLHASYELLGRVSFFTVGEDEVRAWTVAAGLPARQAAGVIHSDLERGFIRAEVVSSEDLLRLRTMSACREAGVLRLEGKEYPVADGEVIHFRFNV